ncbi:DUF4176 domain-containing protein [Listeria welshimeri]|uniref:DUF4176 domain-containing protein n=1 Tax=Listeria welshimeri TaxID=1643 RepID=UPI001623BD6F|nr:DUF4176 domain-containing protein [Listeria welshimeri]MBC1319402.1 DUF4176 domain-containing protein [Listeria welshimeri]MBC1341214.1 DUF4176 domain-containing protein [Listeria welshimeri]MBC1346537.1 DUF4176 domain-containing protein [Listeria welshimeri]MBC1369695.1 DUF4176 domain-containing protein [Listeria welshimeri]MBC1432854.1 DUF4176 domain-containing protein [Listeria welshimeri]
MEELLPLGSVVRLKNGEQQLLIISRFALYNNQGVIGYFEYSGCLYPNGQTDQTSYFFNQEDIEKIYFTGYVNEAEREFRKKVDKELKKIAYPRFELILTEDE